LEPDLVRRLVLEGHLGGAGGGCVAGLHRDQQGLALFSRGADFSAFRSPAHIDHIKLWQII
jgi:hypothetical protein